jgi:hypothetical protein
LKLGNACYPFVHIQNYNPASCFVWLWKLVTHIEEGM